MEIKKIRLLGYYSSPNQKMNPESERIEDAYTLAPLLESSINSLLSNPTIDLELKQTLSIPTVFVFKDEEGNLYGYHNKDKIARLTGVKYDRRHIKQVDLKYKAWFVPGHSIDLIDIKNGSVSNREQPSSSSVKQRKSTTVEKPIRGELKTTKSNSLSRVDEEEIIKVKTRLRLENNYFIGQFSPEKSEGWYRISDIRNTDFTKIEDKERGVKDLAINFRSTKEFNRFAYYRFTWVLLESSPLKFGIDQREEIVPIYPQDIVKCLHDSIVHYPASAAKKITRTLDTLNKQLTQSGKEVFIYELLQNANDYPRKQKDGKVFNAIPVDVEFHITDEYLTFQHTGDYFNAKNIAAICDINDGEKSDNIEAIGYKGIGFKTVFLDNDYVYLSTGNYSFRFDKSATDIINTPWQILPVWTEYSNIHPTIRNIFRQHPNDVFRVKFALKPRDKRILMDRDRDDNYIDLFSSVFDSERVILFIPRIRKVSIFFDNTNLPPIEREKNSSDWCVSEAYTDDIPEEVRERINDVLTNPDADKSDGYDKIPEKYLNFYKTAVKFACKKEGRKLIPVDDAILYCYLPAKRADWGFKFLMNTDMVPNGPRDDIEDIELNHEIAKIAGRQFFYWLKTLIGCGNYELESVFNLIPDFDKCKEKRNDRSYKNFIDEFQNEFEALIKKEPFVPVVDSNGNKSLACIDSIIDDRTGITEKNVMSDSDFISFMEMNEYGLPIQELRESKSFMNFLYNHCPGKMDIDFGDIKEKCTKENFKEWLKGPDNNTRFISHLLNEKEIDGFSEKPIFIEYEGDLWKASGLFYDFDTEGSLIGFLKQYVPHLCEKTRNSFTGNDTWESFAKAHFMDFDAESIISEHIADNENAIELLKNADNSVNFFRFIAQKEVDISDIKEKFPYINEDGNAITDYEGLLYFFSDESYKASKELWLGENVINILSHIYIDNDKENNIKPLFEQLGFSMFNTESFITSIVSGDSDFKDSVNDAISDNFDKSVSLVKYLFFARETIKEKTLLFKDYVISCIDIDGVESYLCNDDIRYFNQSSFAGNSTFEDNKTHEWLSYQMMYCLNPKYFEQFDESDSKNVESFLRQQFGVRTFTDKSFFNDVVLKNRKEIYTSLSDKDKMLSFISYLKRDVSHIFDGSLSYNDIKDMPLLCADGSIITERNANVKLIEYNKDAIELHEKVWCPSVFDVMSEEYSNGLSKEILQLFKIESFDLNVVLIDIVNNGNLNNDIGDSENNVDFWRWIKANSKSINDIENLKSLYFIDTDGVCQYGNSLYISDVYQKNGIESLVKKYDDAATFISDSYLEEDTDVNKSEWLKLFKKLGLKFDNKDILLNSILPNLSTFEEDSVVTMMTKHIKDLKEVWNDRKDEMVQLRVRTKSGDYKTLDKTIIIDVKEETVLEPFKYIELSDEVAPEILENNKEILRLISAECKNRTITSKQDWAEEKVSEYINNIQTDELKRGVTHIEFVRELAKLLVEYTLSSDLLDQILYCVKEDNSVFKLGSEITLGTMYSPICDFESNGVTELSYLSEDYIFEGNRDIIKQFFKARGLHHIITEDDLKYLANRAFACYFWSYCFSRRISEYEDWIERGLFNDIVCIPTESSVKKAKELYFPRMVVYASKSQGWKERVPCKSVVDKIENIDARNLFNKLPFNPTLSFEDCLYYLLNAQDKREDERYRRFDIVNWILEADEIDYNLVDAYRDNPKALWRNGKGQKTHIKELYAIHPEAKQQKAIFSGDEHVMTTNMFPNDTSEFERLCEILKIKYLTGADFVPTPINKVDETAGMMKIIKPRILVLAAIEDPDKYKEIYEKYNEEVSKYRFLVCDKIDLAYDTIHNDVERIYNDDSHIYYVNSWLHNRTYTKFCSKIKSLLGINVYDNICEDVLDGNIPVEQSIEKYCSSLVYDEEFRFYLNNLDCTITVEEEEELEDIEEEYYSEALSTTQYTEVENTSQDEVETTADDTDENDSAEEQELAENEIRSSSENQHGQSESTQKIEPEVIKEPRKPSPEIHEIGNEEETQNKNAIKDSENITDNDINNRSKQSYSKESNEKSRKEDYHTNKEAQDNSDIIIGYDPDQGSYMGSVETDSEYEPIGSKPHIPHKRKAPKPFTKEELDRLRSNGTPLELESLPPTEEEINILAQCGISVEQIADTNFLAQLRLYNNLVEDGDMPEESLEQFVRNASDVAVHKLRDGRYIHSCSAARGVMYISPSVWNKMVDDKWKICVYLDGRGKNFHYINNADEFLHLVEKDDVVIKITGKEKVDVVKQLYSGVLEDVKGTAYTLIRVASRTNMDAVFAHYVGAMAEADDGNDNNEY